MRTFPLTPLATEKKARAGKINRRERVIRSWLLLVIFFLSMSLTPRTATETLAGTEQLHPPCCTGGAAAVAGGMTTVVCMARE